MDQFLAGRDGEEETAGEETIRQWQGARKV
jgi:hypothetical protein